MVALTHIGHLCCMRYGNHVLSLPRTNTSTAGALLSSVYLPIGCDSGVVPSLAARLTQWLGFRGLM